MRNWELLRGQKLLGWVLILVGLLLLILIGLSEPLERRYSLSGLGAFASWVVKSPGNQTMVGVVAWLLLAGGYIFVLSVSLEERLRDIGGELEERISRLTREVAALAQRQGDRSGAGPPADTPMKSPGGGASP
jgi:hypothetical protein